MSASTHRRPVTGTSTAGDTTPDAAADTTRDTADDTTRDTAGQTGGTGGDDAGEFWGVIPAGGAGTRLWPLSREDAPKFLLDLTGSGRTLLQQTVDRLAPLCGHRLLVVTGRRHQDAVHRQLPELARSGLLAEPARRDSMAAIGWAAAVVQAQAPEAIIGSFAADHVIADVHAFAAAVREAIVLARRGWLVTIGIRPTEPATGFGYIHQGDPLEIPGAPNGRRVLEFVEKPDRRTAAAYLDTGAYRWNAGMFVVRAGVLLDLLARYHPRLAGGLRDIAEQPERLAEIWEGLERISIDHAVAEPAAREGKVAVVPAEFAWDDVGDFASLTDLLARLARELPQAAGRPTAEADAGETLHEAVAANTRDGLHVVGSPGLVLGADSSGLVVPAAGRVVAVLGMPDVVVVDTADAVLVTRTDRAQDVKRLVDRLASTGHGDLT